MPDNLDKKILDGIFSIETPLEPDVSYSNFELAIYTAIIILIGFVVWRWYFSPRNIAIRKIKRLALQYSSALTMQPIAFAIADILRHGLNIHYLDARQSFPETNANLQSEWYQYVSSLTELRYARNKPANENSKNIFDQTIYWLKNWP